MVKFRLYFDKDAEIKWLNELSHQGFAMTKFFAGFYWFEPCEKGKYVYQVDFGDRLFHVSNDYREFMRELDIEIIQVWGPWIFLRKLADSQEFQLYTDVDSRITHYTKIRNMLKLVCLIEIVIFFFEWFTAMNGAYIGYAFALLILACIIALANAAAKTTNMIIALEERKGKTDSRRVRRPSIFLAVGLLLNSCALLLKESVQIPSVIHALQMLAILLMLIGVYFTCKRQK